MNDTITLSFNTAEICILVVTVLVIAIFIWLRVKEYNIDSKMKLLTKINDDLERLNSDTRVSKNVFHNNSSISAKDAKGFVEASLSEEELENILSPIFTKIMKASNKGNSEVYIHGKDWFYRDNIKYKEAAKRLEGLGYSIWRKSRALGVIIKW